MFECSLCLLEGWTLKMDEDNFPQIFLALDKTVYVAYIIYHCSYKEWRSLDIVLETWIWVCNGKRFMKSVHSDPISSCCVCHSLINHEQLPVPAQESSLVYMIHVLSGLQPQHSTIWNLLLQNKMDTITSILFFSLLRQPYNRGACIGAR